MSMTYATWVTALSGFLPENLANTTTESPFISGSRYNLVIDRAIEYAELRIYREPKLDFLTTRTTLSVNCSAGARTITKPASMIVVEEVNLITPAGHAADSAGSSRNPLLRTSTPFINSAWPSVAVTMQPEHIAQSSDTTFILGPNPDQAYAIEFYGTVRPTALSSTNTSTFLTTNLPDLFLSATMIFFAVYQKNIGVVQSVGPNEGTTWESIYQSQLEGAAVEEARKKFQGPGWTAEPPTPVATPPRS